MEIRIKLKHRIVFPLIALFLTSGWTLYDDLFEYSKNLEIFNAAYKEAGKNFVDDVKPGDLMRKGLDAMLSSLDPYTVYYSESQTEEALLDRQGEYNGVGCRVFIKNDYPVVSEVFGGYAFSKADVRPGDVIKTINGQSMKGKTISDMSVYLRGAPETDIDVEIEREGKLLSKKVTRVQVITKNVPYSGKIDEQTGFVKLDQFGQKAAAEINDALTGLNKDGKMKYAILDLRDNGGGLLNEAVNIVGLFTGPGQKVVEMRGRTKESNRDWTTAGPSPFVSIPLVVLINAHSASASEVVSGSLQDLDRAVIVGRNSFGKGLVQNFFQLPYRTQMKITTAKYYTPSGRCIQLLDYRHRNADGSAGKMPDSLRTAFKTRNGRTVYDGGGIKPDIEVDEFSGQPLLKYMLSERMLFDYANHYRNTHETIAAARDFALTDEEFNSYLRETSETLTGSILEKLKSALNKSLEDDDLVDAIVESEGVRNKIKGEVVAKLNMFSMPLRYRLTQEILTRYYFDAALYESSFKGDPDLLAAMTVLKNEAEYRKILRP